jgi:hypothetical protein
MLFFRYSAFSLSFFLNIFSTDVNPKVPKANIATASTSTVLGAICS